MRNHNPLPQRLQSTPAAAICRNSRNARAKRLPPPPCKPGVWSAAVLHRTAFPGTPRSRAAIPRVGSTPRPAPGDGRISKRLAMVQGVYACSFQFVLFFIPHSAFGSSPSLPYLATAPPIQLVWPA